MKRRQFVKGAALSILSAAVIPAPLISSGFTHSLAFNGSIGEWDMTSTPIYSMSTNMIADPMLFKKRMASAIQVPFNILWGHDG